MCSTGNMKSIPPCFGQKIRISTQIKQVKHSGFGTHRSEVEQRDTISVLSIDVYMFSVPKL